MHYVIRSHRGPSILTNLPTRPIQPLDTLWQARTIAWIILAGEAVAIVLALAPGINGGRLIYFGLASLIVQWISLMTLGALYLLRDLLAKLNPHTIAYVALALLLLCTWLVCGLAWLTLYDLWMTSDKGWYGFWLRISGITLTVGLLGLAAFQNHWRVRQLALQAKQSELEALQARIRPHFLFNTLNTGAALVHQRPEEAERLLLDLSDLFRAALAGPREIPLAEELALTRRYLEIEGLRFGERLRVDWKLPDVLPPLTVPALSIQPLVENAIRHGVEPTAQGGEVSIEIEQIRDLVEITIGNALPATPVQSTRGHQVGLNSVKARIAAMTQGRGSVEIRITDQRYIAVICLPLHI